MTDGQRELNARARARGLLAPQAIVFEGLQVPRDQVLGEIGQGLRYVQVRLAPARLTHCMRWLGAAACAVVFLTSPAASFVTGASLAVDGGWTAG